MFQKTAHRFEAGFALIPAADPAIGSLRSILLGHSRRKSDSSRCRKDGRQRRFRFAASGILLIHIVLVDRRWLRVLVLAIFLRRRRQPRNR